MMLWFLGDGSGLPAGHHTWPFTFRLPPYIPATFEGQWGRVMYWAKVVIDRPWKGDYDFTKPFTVQGNLDLNTDPDAKVRVKFQWRFYELFKKL